MGQYILFQGERTMDDDLHIAGHLARRKGPNGFDGSLEEFLLKYYVSTWHGGFDNAKADEDVFEELFEEFNINHPAGFRSYSMSVGDIVYLDGRIYWCAPVGFERVN